MLYSSKYQGEKARKHDKKYQNYPKVVEFKF